MLFFSFLLSFLVQWRSDIFLVPEEEKNSQTTQIKKYISSLIY